MQVRARELSGFDPYECPDPYAPAREPKAVVPDHGSAFLRRWRTDRLQGRTGGADHPLHEGVVGEESEEVLRPQGLGG